MSCTVAEQAAFWTVNLKQIQDVESHSIKDIH